MNILALIPLFILQYSVADMEQLCSNTETAEEIIECNYARRINLGLYAPEQLPDLIKLYGIYRVSEARRETIETASRLVWLVSKNDHRGAQEVVEVLTGLPEGDRGRECFIREGWEYERRDTYCQDLRYIVVDSCVLAYDVLVAGKDKETARLLAQTMASLVVGLTGQPQFVAKLVGDYVEFAPNLEIPPNYRVNVWQKRAKD